MSTFNKPFAGRARWSDSRSLWLQASRLDFFLATHSILAFVVWVLSLALVSVNGYFFTEALDNSNLFLSVILGITFVVGNLHSFLLLLAWMKMEPYELLIRVMQAILSKVGL